MIVEPPGCRAQSKSVAMGNLPWVLRSGTDFMRSWNAGETAAEAIAGTRGVRTTFQPVQCLLAGQPPKTSPYHVPNGSTSKPKSFSVSSRISCFQPRSSYIGVRGSSSPMPLLKMDADAQSLNRQTPMRVFCSLSIESNSDRTRTLDISHARTRIFAGLFL